MRRTKEREANSNQAPVRALALTTLLLLAAGNALAQNQPAAATEDGSQKKGERRIVVSIPDRKLALIEDGRVVRIYPVAVGAPGSPTPTGTFRIVNRLEDPAYYAPGVVIPAGKDNPLGPRWLGLDKKRFGIHGTSEPESIGRRASHGCVRMRNQDVRELFQRVRAGDTVELVGQRTAEVAQIFPAPVPPAGQPAPAAPVVVAAITGQM